jgi:hypothetical protein
VSGRKLIAIVSTAEGLDFEVESQAMQAFLDPYEATRGSWTRIPTSEEVEQLKQLARRRRCELAGEFRALARKLELGEWPFSNDGTPDPYESRGAAEREIDALAEHIQRLQERE